MSLEPDNKGTPATRLFSWSEHEKLQHEQIVDAQLSKSGLWDTIETVIEKSRSVTATAGNKVSRQRSSRTVANTSVVSSQTPKISAPPKATDIHQPSSSAESSASPVAALDVHGVERVALSSAVMRWSLAQFPRIPDQAKKIAAVVDAWESMSREEREDILGRGTRGASEGEIEPMRKLISSHLLTAQSRSNLLVKLHAEALVHELAPHIKIGG